MLVKKDKNKSDTEIPMSSLADISFLILIFFMVATTIDMDRGIGMVLPPQGEEQELPKDRITTVLVDPKGKVFLDKKEVEMKNVRQKVEQLLANKPKMIFSVKTHDRTPYQDYINVLDQLKAAQAKNISIAQ